MQQSQTYINASETGKAWMNQNWQTMYEAYVNTRKTGAEWFHEDDFLGLGKNEDSSGYGGGGGAASSRTSTGLGGKSTWIVRGEIDKNGQTLGVYREVVASSATEAIELVRQAIGVERINNASAERRQ